MKRFVKLILVFTTLLTLFSVNIITGRAIYDSSKATNDATLLESYYRNVNTNLSGEDFRRNLSEVISAGYQRHPYSGGSSDVATILRESDADPSGNGNVICIYTGLSMPSSQTGGAYEWDKEHVWAKSHGFPNDSGVMKEAFSDAHNLRPALASVNRSRSNKDHGIVTNPTRTDYGNKQNETTFEPRDESKGDVARIMFYMATRYGFDEVSLALVDDTTTSASSLNGRFGNLQTLIQWHYDDPVSQSEIYRNNVVYGYQNNRNPFIDHPEYVALAYPNAQGGTTVDETKVDAVKQAISRLPDVITLEDADAINSAKAMYDALNSLEKAKVDNYDTLKNALNTLKALQEPITETPDYTYSVTSKIFSNVNQTTDLNGLSWTLEGTPTNQEGYIGFYQNAKGIQLGSASKPFSRIKLTSSKLTKITKVVLYASGATGINASLSCNVGNQTASEAYSLTKDNAAYEFMFEQSNGAVSFSIINNSAKAVYVQRMDIYYTEVDLVPETLILTETHSSLKVNYDSATLEATEVNLRFGVKMLEDAYHPDAKYGIVIVDSSLSNRLVSGEQNFTTINDFVSKENYLEISPVRVNESGEEDANGAYYQFAWVITNMEGHYEDTLSAVIYMEYNNKVYFGISETNSLVNVATNYLEEDLIQNEDLKIVLQKIIKGSEQDSSWLPWV
ncbi:MAG: endonuclease [Anaeroplasmataceae bacterium]|nr:endonuclease [Anaeroplasmataceae bacterium]